MKSPNRDLLVLLKDEYMSEHAIEQEVERLNEMLFHVESFENIAHAHELIDLNKFRISQQKKKVLQVLRDKEMKPFIFLFNMN
jgi:transcriptional regulator of NAD metabolism